MTPRLARGPDLDAVQACVNAAFEPFVARIGRRPAPMDDDYATMIARGGVWVVGEGEAVMACHAADGIMHLDVLAALPSAQGRGLGRLLVAHCERLAQASGLAAVELYTNAAMSGAQHLYAALGYTEVARGVHEGFMRVFYRKVL
jgi:ribosomal protein S18 acetylase RimI-like enzyme